MASDSSGLERYSPSELAAFYRALDDAQQVERYSSRKRARSRRRTIHRSANGDVHVTEEEYELNDDSFGDGRSPYRDAQAGYDTWASQPWFARIFGN